MSTLEERALADSDDSDRFVRPGYGDAISSFVGTIQRLDQVQRERDEALAALARVSALLGDTDGPLWAVRGIREADIRAALEGKAQR